MHGINEFVARLLALLIFLLIAAPLNAQTAAPENQQLWGALKINFDPNTRLRLQALMEKHNGEDVSHAQWKVGGLITYRVKRMKDRLMGDNDDENQHNLVVGGGYEFIRTNQNDNQKQEHRLVLQSTPKYFAPYGFLLQDRSRIEFRWIDDGYNFRYRNKLSVERSLEIKRRRIIPFASGELFWDRNHHAWNENQYDFGVALPIRERLRFEVYYKRKNCTTCTADPLNIFGVTAIIFARQAQ